MKKQMTRAETIEILKKLIEAMQGHVTVLPTPERIAAIRLAIASLETDEAYQLEQEPCDTCRHHENGCHWLPSVTPQEPRKGHWIDKRHLLGSCSAECSSCHKRSDGFAYDNGFSLEYKYYDFCPKCGSDNREVKE